MHPQNHTETHIPAHGFDDMPTDPAITTRIPRITHTDPEQEPGWAPITQRPPRPAAQPNYQDMVVPRVYLEPDEHLDELRQRSLRWAITRDRLAVIALIYALGWATRPVWSFLADTLTDLLR